MDEKFLPPNSSEAMAVPATGTQFTSASRIEWHETGVAGFLTKPLFVSGDGQSTSLMKIEPGAVSEPHSHETIEQIYVIEGGFYDQDNRYEAGDLILRAPGAVHMAGSKTGALVIVTSFNA